VRTEAGSDQRRKTRVKDLAAEAMFSAGWTIVRRMPARLAFGLLRLVADLIWWRRWRGVRQLERNLQRVRPKASPSQLRALSRAGMRSYFRYWCEAFRLPDIRVDEIDRSVRTHDEETFWTAFSSGRGVIAALPHMANWDLAGAWASTHGAPVTTVAERLRPEGLFDRFVAYRARLGIHVIPVTGGDDPMGRLTDRLREGGLVCLLADRDLSARGVEVTFFGEPTTMPAGPAVLAVRTGAVLMPVTLWYDGPQMHIRFHPPLDVPDSDPVRTLTQRLADVFAESIGEHPEDWHMLQRLWLADRSGGRSMPPESHRPSDRPLVPPDGEVARPTQAGPPESEGPKAGLTEAGLAGAGGPEAGRPEVGRTEKARRSPPAAASEAEG
jgi:KDO2-lipid IV(A) lauroyltransferase